MNNAIKLGFTQWKTRGVYHWENLESMEKYSTLPHFLTSLRRCLNYSYQPNRVTFNQGVRDSSSRRSTNRKDRQDGGLFYWYPEGREPRSREARMGYCHSGIYNILMQGLLITHCKCSSFGKMAQSAMRNIAARLAKRDLVSGAKFPQKRKSTQ